MADPGMTQPTQRRGLLLLGIVLLLGLVCGAALFHIGQHLGPLVIKQNDMKRLRPVGFPVLPRPAVHRVVGRERLTGAHHRKHGEEQCQVLETRQHLLDAHQCDHRLW